jgi:hypothetical protein
MNLWPALASFCIRLYSRGMLVFLSVRVFCLIRLYNDVKASADTGVIGVCGTSSSRL